MAWKGQLHVSLYISQYDRFVDRIGACDTSTIDLAIRREGSALVLHLVHSGLHLVYLGLDLHLPGFLQRPGRRDHDQRRQHADDRNHDQQFDEREGRVGSWELGVWSQTLSKACGHCYFKFVIHELFLKFVSLTPDSQLPTPNYLLNPSIS